MSDGSFSRTPRPYVSRATDPRDRDLHAPERQPPERPAADDGTSGDPLAELARLIGQSDPFAPVAPRGAAPARYSEPAPAASRDSPDRYDDRAQDRARLDQVHPDPGLRDWPRAAQPPFRFPGRPAPTDPAAASAETADHAGHSGGDHHHDSAHYAQHDDEVTVAVDHVAEMDHGAQAEYAEEYAEAEGYEHNEDGYEDEFEEHHDSAAALKRRNGVKLAIAVLGLAVFGTAAAFGYRALFKGGVTGPPQVIHAETSPTKVFPADANAKPIGERVASGGTERVVRRDEDPVDLRDPARTGAIVPGTGGPVTVAPMVPNASPAGSAPQSASPPALTEPKRVRTVTIRADQPNAAPDRGIGASPPRTIPPAPRQASPAAPPQSSAPLPLTPQVVATAEPPPASPAPVRQPPPPAAHAADGSGNGYVVQLSAQKSEAEAQASLRAAQAKYSALSGQPPLIRRKDQGDRGIFYAAQVGPFGSRDQATQLCESLKSAGGNCFVAKN